MSMNDNGTKIYGSEEGGNGYVFSSICDGDDSTYYRTPSTVSSLRLTYEFPYKVKISKMRLKYGSHNYNTNTKISGSNNGIDWEQLFASNALYNNVAEVSLTGNTDYYRYYRLESTSEGQEIMFVYVWDVSEIQGIIYDTFTKSYININNLGPKKINGTIKYKDKYSLIYNGQEWEMSNNIITGVYADSDGSSKTVAINLGVKPKYVFLINESNATSYVAVDSAGTVHHNEIPRIITEFSGGLMRSGDAITEDGFIMSLGSVSGTQTHQIYYIAVC